MVAPVGLAMVAVEDQFRRFVEDNRLIDLPVWPIRPSFIWPLLRLVTLVKAGARTRPALPAL